MKESYKIVCYNERGDYEFTVRENFDSKNEAKQFILDCGDGMTAIYTKGDEFEFEIVQRIKLNH